MQEERQSWFKPKNSGAERRGNRSVKMETAVLALAASAALSLTSMGAAAGETENWPYQTEVQDEGQRETGQRRKIGKIHLIFDCLLYTSPSPRDTR